MLAIIGGSGLNQLGNLEATQRKATRTPYGEPSGALTSFATRRTAAWISSALAIRSDCSRKRQAACGSGMAPSLA